MTEYDNCSKSKAKTMLENKIWAQNSNFWNLLSGQKNEDKGMISHRICMEAISTFFGKDGSNDQRIAMFPYKMDTLYILSAQLYNP